MNRYALIVFTLVIILVFDNLIMNVSAMDCLTCAEKLLLERQLKVSFNVEYDKNEDCNIAKYNEPCVDFWEDNSDVYPLIAGDFTIWIPCKKYISY